MSLVMNRRKYSAFAVTAFSAMFALTACGAPANNTPTNTPEPAMTQSSTPSASASETMMDPAADLVGPGCEAYAKMVPGFPQLDPEQEKFKQEHRTRVETKFPDQMQNIDCNTGREKSRILSCPS